MYLRFRRRVEINPCLLPILNPFNTLDMSSSAASVSSSSLSLINNSGLLGVCLAEAPGSLSDHCLKDP